MSVTIPGALADHLAAERPFDLDTRATLDDAHRGRGRTLVIEPKTIAPLHVISRRAEYLLGNAYATRPQKEAARVWLKRAGHAPQIITTRYASTEEAYDASQCSEDTRAGDVLVVEAEQAVAFLWKAWPCAVTVAHGQFHRAEGDPREVEANTGPSVRAAMDAAYAIGAPLARDEDQLEAAQALEQAAAADAPEAQPTLEAGLAAFAALPANVRCVIHGVTCDNDAKRRHEFRTEPTAAEQRLDQLADEEAAKFATVVRAVDAVEHAEQTGAAADTLEDAEALFAAQLVTEAEADAGTWRGEWIGQQADDALFALEPATEQGALFTDRATAPTTAEAAPEPTVAAPYCSPEVTRASVDAYLARTYPALLALRDGQPPF